MNGSAYKSSTRLALALGAALVSTMLCTPADVAASEAAGKGQSAFAALPAHGERACPVVYFDLGETLVHTAADGSTTYLPGAASYLRTLREHHVRVGLITNVPPSWGTTDAERAARLRTEVDATWRGPAAFAWADFGDRIRTPRTEAERKPSPVLWQRAKEDSAGCRVVYQAETAQEVSVASSLGFVSYQVGLPYRPAFLPAGLIELLGRRLA
ncbi:hypothetical protein [Streptomyces sp. NBC_00199]|uniref:hypothetical protein n=1 Tax=Streptomyces sp. NBC_00199 TaxID=2975678 RepID=UPI002251C208|nr:hypothetical protein [Streptomyces sp. NBC_00199]MCX5265671.1 hypothetical protein [Streptomyces sp. NBC_00199]